MSVDVSTYIFICNLSLVPVLKQLGDLIVLHALVLRHLLDPLIIVRVVSIRCWRLNNCLGCLFLLAGSLLLIVELLNNINALFLVECALRSQVLPRFLNDRRLIVFGLVDLLVNQLVDVVGLLRSFVVSLQIGCLESVLDVLVDLLAAIDE